MPDRQTPTECLISSLEDIDRVEDVFIICRSKEGEEYFISWQGNEIDPTEAIWLMEFVKLQLLTCAADEDEEDD
jgi:hypothetical protein